MARTLEVPVVQFVQFFANDRCLADPALFQATRNIAQGWQEKGLNAQYWGTSVENANEFYWLLLWQSHAHAAAVKAEPSYPTFVQDREALATKPVYEVHVPFSGNPQCLLEAPVTEVDYYKMDDGKVNPAARPVAETQERILRTHALVESLQLPGFIAFCRGADIDDETRAVTLGGWSSIEDHMRLGTLDEHSKFLEEAEEIFKNLTELSITHVHFKLHGALSSA